MSNPVSSFMDNAIDGMAEGVRTIEQVVTGEEYKTGEKKGEKKWKTSVKRFADQATSTVSKLKGIPYDTVKKMLQGIWRLATGGDEETTTTMSPTFPKPPRPPRP